MTVAGVISQNTPGATYAINATATTLSVTTTPGYYYQWYSNTINANYGGIAISGANSSSYTPPTNIAGTTYYYCLLTSAACVQVSAVSGAIVVQPCTSTPYSIQFLQQPTNSTKSRWVGSRKRSCN